MTETRFRSWPFKSAKLKKRIEKYTHFRHAFEQRHPVRNGRHLLDAHLQTLRGVIVESDFEHFENGRHGEHRGGILVADVDHPLHKLRRYL